MATTKGKSSSRKNQLVQKPTAKQLEAQNRARRQMWAVVLFALGILFGALALVKGTASGTPCTTCCLGCLAGDSSSAPS